MNPAVIYMPSCVRCHFSSNAPAECPACLPARLRITLGYRSHHQGTGASGDPKGRAQVLEAHPKTGLHSLNGLSGIALFLAQTP
ncbi:MAG: hypothetical protein ACI835_003720 [Planctomycetota bacterium]|jgi:hypothetical protein